MADRYQAPNRPRPPGTDDWERQQARGATQDRDTRDDRRYGSEQNVQDQARRAYGDYGTDESAGADGSARGGYGGDYGQGRDRDVGGHEERGQGRVGGSYGQGEFGDTARRSQWRQDNRTGQGDRGPGGYARDYGGGRSGFYDPESGDDDRSFRTQGPKEEGRGGEPVRSYYGQGGGGERGGRDQDRNRDPGAQSRSYYAGGSEGRGRYGGSQAPSQPREEHHDFEHGYVDWRNAKLDTHDRDYQAWRQEQTRKYDEDYRQFRQERTGHFHHTFQSWRMNRDTLANGLPRTDIGAESGDTGAVTAHQPESASYGAGSQAGQVVPDPSDLDSTNAAGASVVGNAPQADPSGGSSSVGGGAGVLGAGVNDPVSDIADGHQPDRDDKDDRHS